MVPLPGGKAATIEHKSIDHTEKTLGAMMSPDEDSATSIQMMQEKHKLGSTQSEMDISTAATFGSCLRCNFGQESDTDFAA
jgi:hypothetical protein